MMERKLLIETDFNTPEELEAKLKNFFGDRLPNLEEKFSTDLEQIEEIKYQFLDCYKQYHLAISKESEETDRKNGDLHHNEKKNENVPSMNHLTIMKTAINTTGFHKIAETDRPSTDQIKKPMTTRAKDNRSKTPVRFYPNQNVVTPSNLKAKAPKKENLNRSAITDGTKADKKNSHLTGAKTGDSKKSSMIYEQKKAKTRSIIEAQTINNSTILKTEPSIKKEVRKSSTINNVQITPNKKKSIFNSDHHQQGKPSKKTSNNGKKGSLVGKSDSNKEDKSNLSKENLSSNIGNVKIEGKEVDDSSRTNSDGTSNKPKKQQINFKKLPQPIDDASNNLKALHILTTTENLQAFLPLELRYKLLTAVPQLFKANNVKILAEERVNELKKEKEQLEEMYKNNFNNQTTSDLIAKEFTPSKTAQNGLAFVTKEEEANLCKKKQPAQIINIFKLIYILLGEDNSAMEDQEMIQNLFSNIFSKVGVDTIKSLFIKHIVKHTDLDEQRYTALMNVIKENPKLLSSPDLLKINRSVSYMTFILKEAFDYFTAKTSDGVELFKLRNAKKVIDQYREKIDYLESKLAAL